jgi:tRNA A-37 threonylcarbamoyl transferase component Bud32
MSVGDMASSTVVWMKEFTTNGLHKVIGRMYSIGSIKRIPRGLAICLVVWIVAGVAGYFTYRYQLIRLKQNFYQQGIQATQNLAAEARSYILDRDYLALSIAVKEIDAVENLHDVGIIDHKNNILAHTDTDSIHALFKPMQDEKSLQVINDTRISSGLSKNNKKLIRYSKSVTFANVEIGVVHITISAGRLNQMLNSARVVFFSGIGVLTALLGLIYFWMGRSIKSKAMKRIEAAGPENRIGPYILHHKIGEGGMAELFLAEYISEEGFRRRVAVKRILPRLAEKQDFIKMFTREARVAAQLQHPNIVQIADYRRVENSYFIAMEFISGKNLGVILKTLATGLPVAHTIFIVSEICKGLDYSHNKKNEQTGEPLNIVHRDISPQNILVSFQGEVKISDFGISKASSEPSITRAGEIKGKLAYLAPEQASGRAVDHRADIFALGLVFYEVLTGRKVYQFENDIEAIRTILIRDIEPLLEVRPGIPKELNPIVMKCLHRNISLRYQNTSEIYKDLTALRRKLRLTFDASDLANFMNQHFKKNDLLAGPN